MIPAFKPEQKAVLNEYVHNAKVMCEQGHIIIGEGFESITEQMMYDFEHGKSESLELLNMALPFLQGMYDLSEDEFEILEKEAAQIARNNVRYWEYVEELPPINPNYIAIKGANYVILKTGIRLDYGTDYYQHLREQFDKTGVYDEGMR